jgi:hypothetical protein
MGATNRAVPFASRTVENSPENLGAASVPLPPLEPRPAPALRLVPLVRPIHPRRFVRVPTHSVGVYPEQREYPRAPLKLPLHLRSIAGLMEKYPVTLVTRDISSTGVFFLSPRHLDLGTSIELEIVLVSRPLGLGNVVMTTRAHVRRLESTAMPDWIGVAASFDDMHFDRDDGQPSRLLQTR